MLFQKDLLNQQVVLGSSSPRRKSIFRQLQINYIVAKPSFDESLLLKELSSLKKASKFNFFRNNLIASKLKEIVMGKYLSLKELSQDRTVFCFDTVIVFEGRVLGKPVDLEDAKRTLLNLSAKSHKVLTTCLAAKENKIFIKIYSTKVIFKKLSLVQIKKYLQNEDVLDAAGSYKIQENGLSLVESIKGSYYNVVGMPFEFINDCLKYKEDK